MQRDGSLGVWPGRAWNSRSSHIWHRRWTRWKAVARQNRNNGAWEVGTSSRLFDRKLVVGADRFPFVAKRPISGSVLFRRLSLRIGRIRSLRHTPGEAADS